MPTAVLVAPRVRCARQDTVRVSGDGEKLLVGVEIEYRCLAARFSGREIVVEDRLQFGLTRPRVASLRADHGLRMAVPLTPLWIDPVTNAYRQQIGKRKGADIVQEGTTETEALSRWSFTEITPR